VAQLLSKSKLNKSSVLRSAVRLLQDFGWQIVKGQTENGEACACIAGSPVNTTKPLPVILASKRKDASLEGATSNQNTKNQASEAFAENVESSVKITFALLVNTMSFAKIGASIASG
jgi:hypothetical protein